MRHKTRVEMIRDAMNLDVQATLERMPLNIIESLRVREGYVGLAHLMSTTDGGKHKRIWMRCLQKLGYRAGDPQPTTDLNQDPEMLDLLAIDVVCAAYKFHTWRWASCILRAMELQGWKPKRVRSSTVR